MRGLVERLRHGEGIGACLSGQHQYAQEIMNEAADEIERLQDLITDRQSDNGRLRAALEEFLGYRWRSVEKDNMEFQATVTCYTLEKARKALKDKP